LCDDNFLVKTLLDAAVRLFPVLEILVSNFYSTETLIVAYFVWLFCIIYLFNHLSFFLVLIVYQASFIFRGGLGSLAAWYVPGGPIGPPARWAATSNLEGGRGTEEAAHGP